MPLGRFERTPYGYKPHEFLSMIQESSRQVLKELGRESSFEDNIGDYIFNRPTHMRANAIEAY